MKLVKPEKGTTMETLGRAEGVYVFWFCWGGLFLVCLGLRVEKFASLGVRGSGMDYRDYFIEIHSAMLY